MYRARDRDYYKNCLCDDCVHSIQSKNGSDLNRLLRKKYLPKDKQLLEQLIKKRTEYDNLRNEIISASNISFYSLSDNLEKEKKDVLKLVDLIDKGKYPSSRSTVNLHSECCSCCFCSPNIRQEIGQFQSLPIPSDDQISHHLEYQSKKSRTHQKLVKFRRAISEPCMCTLKFSNIKKLPRKISDRFSNLESIERISRTFKKEKKKVICECPPATNIKTARDRMRDRLRSSIDSSRNAFIQSKRSTKEARDRIRSSIRSSMSRVRKSFRIRKDSIMLYKEKLNKKAWMCDPDFCYPDANSCIPNQCYEKVKFREASISAASPIYPNQSYVSVSASSQTSQLTKKHQETTSVSKGRKVKCECKPEIKSAVSIRQSPNRKVKQPMSDTSMSPSVKIEILRQGQNKKQGIEVSEISLQTLKSPRKRQRSLSKTRKKSKQKKVICRCKTKTKSVSVSDTEVKETQAHRSLYSVDEPERISSAKSIERLRNLEVSRSLVNTSSKRQAVKISSSFKFEIEFYKNKGFVNGTSKTSQKDQIQYHNAKEQYDIPFQQERNQTTNSLYKSKAHHDVRSHPKNIEMKRSFNNSEKGHYMHQEKNQQTDKFYSKNNYFPRPCEPFMCVPRECYPKDCAIQLLTKSTAVHELKRCFCTLHSQKSSKSSKKYKSKSSRTDVVKPVICECEIKRTISIQTSKKFNKQAHKSERFIDIQIKKPSKRRNVNTTTNENIPKRQRINSFSLTKPQASEKKSRVPKHLRRSSKKQTGKSSSSPDALQKQAIRIGSSFRFDIEFYKDTYIPDRKDIMVKAEDNTNHLFETGYEKTQSSLFKRKFKDKSKVIRKQPKQRSKPTMTDGKNKFSKNQTTIECFCDPSMASKELQTEAIFECLCKPENIMKNQASITNKYFVNYSLLPYECEPYFCTPGECDPYVCLERIKSRNRSRTINTTPMTTKSIITQSRIGSTQSTGTLQVPRKQKRTIRKEERKQPIITKSSPSPSHKQAVKLGSSFRFDIEFYKTTTDVSQPDSQTGLVSTKQSELSTQSYTPKLKTKRLGDRHTNRKHKTSETRRGTKSRTSSTRALKRCFCTLELFGKKPKIIKPNISTKSVASQIYNKDEIYDSRSYATQTRRRYSPPTPSHGLLPYECEPDFCIPGQCDPYVCYERIKKRNFLQRCFCTLNIRKNLKNRGNVMSERPQKRNVSTRTRDVRHTNKLLPYECSPGVCDPYNCDPYECYDRIKRRNAIEINYHNRFASTDRPRYRTMSSSSATELRQKNRSVTNEFDQPKRNWETHKHEGTDNRDTSKTYKGEDTNYRQAVRIGSNFSFNIEFYRNQNIKNDNLNSEYANANESQTTYANKEIQHRQHGGRHRAAQDFHSHENKYSEAKPRRCFCTLKLFKRGKRHREYDELAAMGSQHGAERYHRHHRRPHPIIKISAKDERYRKRVPPRPHPPPPPTPPPTPTPPPEPAGPKYKYVQKTVVYREPV